jgi:hypothetical protein
MTEERKYAILFAATLLSARRMLENIDSDKPNMAEEFFIERTVIKAARILEVIGAPRITPHDEFVRRGNSPRWFCFVVECLQCGELFHLKWLTSVEKFEETAVVHVKCPSCLFEFAKTGDKLIGGWTFTGMVTAGRVTRVVEVGSAEMYD